MIALDRDLCIYGMTCCAAFITIFEMSIRDIWSKPDLSKIKKPVRYDFKRVDFPEPSGCSRRMNTLHYYGKTFVAQSVMQDG